MENIKTWDDVVENVVENIVGNIHVQHVPHDMVNVLHDMGGMSWGTLVFFTCCPRHPPMSWNVVVNNIKKHNLNRGEHVVGSMSWRGVVGDKNTPCRGERRGDTPCRGIMSWAHLRLHVVEACRGERRGQHMS